MKNRLTCITTALLALMFAFASCNDGGGGDNNTVSVTSVSLNKTTTTLAVDGTETLVPTIQPPNATNKNATWDSSNTGVATVNSSTGLVTGVSAGTTTITVTTQDGNKTATCTVTVSASAVAVTDVTLNKTSTTLTVGGTETLVPTIQPPNATNKNVTWSSSTTGVATVNSSTGLVTGVNAGTTTITVTTQDGNKTATCAVAVTSPPIVRHEGNSSAPEQPLSIWYRRPSNYVHPIISHNPTVTTTINPDYNKMHNSDILPIGNGRMAAMVQGDIISERLQFNEESLWTGGPGGREAHVDQGSTTSSAYSFGYNSTSTNQDTIYNALKNGGTNSPGSGIPGMIQGNYNGYGRYKNFGYLNLDYKFPSGSTTVYDYRRELDLENGEARVQYRANNITYTREYIASYPDNTIAVRISADSGGKVNLGVSAIPGQPDGKIGTTIQQPTVTASNGTITLSGGLYDNGLLYTAVFKVDATGGSLTTDPTTATINIANADTVTIYFSAATDFKNEFKLSATNNFNDLKYRTGETLEQITARVASKLAPMSDSGYVSFKNKHRQDYKNLFDRVSFNIGGTNALPTDTAKDDYKKASNTVAPQHQMLETLMYQYGRYLLIASSREGSLPANLQGKWNNINNPPWCADYHTNINLQMNYWPAGGADLLETMEPLQKYTESLMVTGRYTAQKYSYPASTPADAWKEPGSGWATHVSGGIFGFTAPGTSWSWGWSPAANAFLCQNLYQYLQYGGDKETFKNDYWPIIREAAIMWTKSLYKPTDGLWAGKYVALPSYSPEHGPLTVATAYDQQLVWELFTIALDCLKQLDLESSDAALKANIEEKLNGLYPGIKIGTLGQIQEWSELPADNAGEGIGNHRHMSQMVGFYPGTSIANGNQTNFDAAKKTLELRGLGATGWSMGWKINLWARSKNASQTYRLVNNLLKDNTALNLFDLHDVRFQIDGNFGYTAGVQEMLLQSHLGALDLLPALPNAWAKGSIKGIRSIGGHKLNMSWDGSKLTSAEIEAFSDGNIKVRCASFDNATVKVDDSVVSVQDASITIAATKGRKYVVSVN